MKRIIGGNPPALPLSVSPAWASQLLWLPDRSRNMGVHLVAGRGSGKSRFLGRVIGWQDFIRGTPLVVFDPVGQTIANLLDKAIRLPREVQERLWRRIVYVDMSGKSGQVIPFPLYYRLGNESLFEISQRYLDVIRKLDPHLQTASIQGWNPLWRIGTFTGMVLAALGGQITEAESLITNTFAWLSRIEAAQRQFPELRPAVEFFDEFTATKPEARARQSESFLNKVSLFTDPAMRALFGASQPGVHWGEVSDKRQALLFDFHNELSIEARRLKMVWVLTSLLDYIKYRGPGRHRPISIIIDELTAMFSAQTLATDLFAADVDELVNILARNYMIWLTIAHQELFQLNDHAAKTLMAMGTQIIGPTSDRKAAIELAKQFYRYDPTWVRKREPVYASSHGVGYVIDERTIEYTMEEQAVLRSHLFLDRGRFHFLVRVAQREGDTTRPLTPVTLENFDAGAYPNEQLVDQAEALLMEKRGRKVSEVLAEIESRQRAVHQLPTPSPSAKIAKTPARRQPSATIGNDEPTSDEPVFGERKTARNSRDTTG